MLVGVELQLGGAEGIVVAHEARTEHLGEVHVITPVGIGEVVTVVEHEGESHAIVVGMSVHSRQELGALDVLADDVVLMPESEEGFLMRSVRNRCLNLIAHKSVKERVTKLLLDDVDVILSENGSGWNFKSGVSYEEDCF